MALFGRKKKVEAKQPSSTEDLAKEMDIILEARREEEEAREAKIREREEQQAQEAQELQEAEAKAAIAAAEFIEAYPPKTGDSRFFIVADDLATGTSPKNDGDFVVGGMLRGKLVTGQRVMIYHGIDSINRATVNAIRNDGFDYIEEASDMKVILEISTDDFPNAEDPDDENETPFEKYSLITNDNPDASPVKTADEDEEDEDDSYDVRLPAMLCEFTRYPEDTVYYGMLTNALMTTNFLVPARIAKGRNDEGRITFAGLKNSENKLPMLPAFTGLNTLNKSNKVIAATGFNSALKMDFNKVSSIAGDVRHEGLVVDAFGPVILAMPSDLIATVRATPMFTLLFGDEADNEQAFIADDREEEPEQVPLGQKKGKDYLLAQPMRNAEYMHIEEQIKQYGGTHADIAKMTVLVSQAKYDEDDISYVCIVDCPEDKFRMHTKSIETKIRPFLKDVKKVQFHLFSNISSGAEFFKNQPWAYSKLPQ